MHHVAEYQLKKANDNYDPTSTNLRNSINELKMGYTFMGVPESAEIKTLGVAPMGRL